MFPALSIRTIALIFSSIGAIIMIATGLIQKKKHVLTAQCAQFGLLGISNLLLGGYTAVITNVVSILRNLFCLKWKLTLPIKIIFIIIQVVLGLAFNDQKLLGWLPIIAAGIFTWFLDTQSDLLLKKVIMGTCALWIIFDGALGNYPAMACDIFTVCSSFYGIILILKSEKKSNDQKA